MHAETFLFYIFFLFRQSIHAAYKYDFPLTWNAVQNIKMKDKKHEHDEINFYLQLY